ncbi:GNAT family N-acetyltransferase [Parasedimentitalea maritima]|nr:GNAT family N-acetyltransferase [Zongyanglinia marina]
MIVGEMGIVIREVDSDDVEIVSTFVGYLLAELTGGDAPNAVALKQTALEVLANNSVTGLLALRGETPVGLIMLNECAAIYAGGRFGEISELYVSPQQRSTGVAAQLVAEAAAYGQRKGWQRLEVGAPTQPEWKRTVEFYERNGFAEVGPRLRRLI